MDQLTISFIQIIAVFVLKMTCIILGYKVVKLGYNLMVEGVKGNFNFTAEYKGIKAGLISASPGLLFLLLGIGLVVVSIYIKKEYHLEVKSSVMQIDSTQINPKNFILNSEIPKDSL